MNITLKRLAEKAASEGWRFYCPVDFEKFNRMADRIERKQQRASRERDLGFFGIEDAAEKNKTARLAA